MIRETLDSYIETRKHLTEALAIAKTEQSAARLSNMIGYYDKQIEICEDLLKQCGIVADVPSF